MRFSLLCALALSLTGCATTAVAPPALFTQSFGARPQDAGTLYVVVHSDGVRAKTDLTPFAKALAAADPGSAVVRVVRPGYTDEAGNASPGTRGTGSGDNYTRERVMAVGDAIAALRQRYRKARVVAIGEGGGAVVVANLAGIRSGLLDGMVLVSCACALPEWRRYRAKAEPDNPRWQEPVTSLDPLQTAGGIAPETRVAILVGAEDTAIPPRFSRAYAEALSLRGIPTDFRIIPGRTTTVIDAPDVIEATRRLSAALPRSGT